jgi:hypothetical protein
MKYAFKRGQAVKYRTKAQSGAGTVSGFKDTVKGVWYLIKTASGAVITLRAASLVAA